MSDLRNCPFCGGKAEAKTWEVGNFGDREAGVTCTGCGATFGNAIDFGATPDEVEAELVGAVERWNRRADADQTLRGPAEIARLETALQIARRYVLSAKETFGADDDAGWIIQQDLKMVDEALAGGGG